MHISILLKCGSSLSLFYLFLIYCLFCGFHSSICLCISSITSWIPVASVSSEAAAGILPDLHFRYTEISKLVQYVSESGYLCAYRLQIKVETEGRSFLGSIIEFLKGRPFVQRLIVHYIGIEQTRPARSKEQSNLSVFPESVLLCNHRYSLCPAAASFSSCVAQPFPSERPQYHSSAYSSVPGLY